MTARPPKQSRSSVFGIMELSWISRQRSSVRAAWCTTVHRSTRPRICMRAGRGSRTRLKHRTGQPMERRGRTILSTITSARAVRRRRLPYCGMSSFQMRISTNLPARMRSSALPSARRSPPSAERRSRSTRVSVIRLATRIHRPSGLLDVLSMSTSCVTARSCLPLTW